MSLAANAPANGALGVPSRFRVEFYDCLYARADSSLELTDAMLCTGGPVKTLIELSLAVEHRREHGALHVALDCGRRPETEHLPTCRCPACSSRVPSWVAVFVRAGRLLNVLQGESRQCGSPLMRTSPQSY
ncbi:transposase [Kitasatospora sp. NPDC058046]|uniref:transposase n=1 Tax=Kitasatospora sp. NPDC058046 TaxID=3346312 RepID=UPI0036DE6078